MARRKSGRVAAKFNDGTQPRKTVGIDCPQWNRPAVQRPVELDYQSAVAERLLVDLKAAADNVRERTYLEAIAAARGPLPLRKEMSGNFVKRPNVNLPCAVGGPEDQQGRAGHRRVAPAEHRPADREAHHRAGADFPDSEDCRDARPLSFQAFYSFYRNSWSELLISKWLDLWVPICRAHAIIANAYKCLSLVVGRYAVECGGHLAARPPRPATGRSCRGRWRGRSQVLGKDFGLSMRLFRNVFPALIGRTPLPLGIKLAAAPA
jgi:hypothetical protein